MEHKAGLMVEMAKAPLSWYNVNRISQFTVPIIVRNSANIKRIKRFRGAFIGDNMSDLSAILWL